MNIWIIEIGEPLPFEVGARLHRYGMFSKWLAAKGHKVTWWTSCFSHAAKRHLFESDKEEVIDGVRVIALKGPGYRKNVSIGRIYHQVHFAKRFTQEAERELGVKTMVPDIVFAPVPSIEGAASAVHIAKKVSALSIVDIRDVWPDELRDLFPTWLRGLAARTVLAPYYSMMRSILGECSLVTGVSQSYLNYGLKLGGRHQSKYDFVYPLGYHRQALTDAQKTDAKTWFTNLNIPDDSFVICFFGTLGNYFDLETVHSAAQSLGREFQFIIGGDGNAAQHLKGLASHIDNVHYVGWVKNPEIQQVMARAQVGLAPYKLGSKMSLPNKIFEYMSAGLPIVSSIQHEARELLEKHNAGLYYKADSSEELGRALTSLRNSNALRLEMAENSRRLYEQSFTPEKLNSACLKQVLDAHRALLLSEKAGKSLS